MATAKYQPLEDYLRKCQYDMLPMTFKDIEKLIGEPLPASARRHRAWWSNNPSNSTITYAWLNAGYKTTDVEMERGRLVFRRQRPAPRPFVPAGAGGAAALPSAAREEGGTRHARVAVEDDPRIESFEDIDDENLPGETDIDFDDLPDRGIGARERAGVETSDPERRHDAAGSPAQCSMQRRVETGGEPTGPLGGFLACLKGLLKLRPGADVVSPADPDWGGSDSGGDRRS